MKKYFLSRLIQLVPILFGITFLTFGMMQFAADDAVDIIYQQSGSVAEEIKAAKRAELGLDQPFLIQYGQWLGGVLTGDMGRSFISGKLVFETFADKLPATIELMLVSILLTIFIATPLGILSAVNQNRPLDYLIRGLSFVGNSMPNFLSGKLGIDLSDSTNQYELNYNNLLTTIKGENHKPRLKIKKNPVSSENVTSEEAPAPITILDIITDEVTIPKMDGTRGCALYKVPLRLSRRPSDVWIKIFLQTWQYPPKSTTMHRPGIARVEGTKIILDGTTIEEVRDYHRETLKLCVDAANKKEKE